ncbi:uncharacterized protein LOC124922119 [Impatiens glandulifera]|uniref:uncharacterized protein LOC124922119 n=1 Tax=Impatiens glandulifera TaxID=253017 RepID=UPI001FB11DAA|nr:uncharacterized protein LOC124922119 [Impatiens glandulifera]
MSLLVTSDTTTLSYWLNWRVFLCSVWVLAPIPFAVYILWKYECPDNSKSVKNCHKEHERIFWHGDETWKPCLKQIHPLWLLAFRLVGFFILSATLIADLVVHGFDILLYYTQWTFVLVTIYFGIGSIISICGCYPHCKIATALNAHHAQMDTENGLFIPLSFDGASLEVRRNEKSSIYDLGKLEFANSRLSQIFQVIFQMSAGAVMLTDCVYWFIIFPFLTLKDYDMNVLTVLTHSINLVVLLGDTALNSLRFPWFRISYFIMFTGVYVIFQWIIHASLSLWWPYPFLDLSATFAPVWYLSVALMHLPCYALYALIMGLKRYILYRWFLQ